MSAQTLEGPVEGTLSVDFVEEMRLRTWARRNYAPRDQRDRQWHPVVIDEMRRIDEEQSV